MIQCLMINSTNTGSTFLGDAIGSHPAIHVYGEMFHLHPGGRFREHFDDPWKFLMKINGGLARLHYHQARFYDIEQYLLGCEVPFPIVHLIRANSLSKVLSDCLQGAEDDAERLERAKAVTPDWVTVKILEYEHNKTTYRARLPISSTLEVGYESMIHDNGLTDTVAKAICSHVAVEERALQSRIRQNARQPDRFYLGHMWDELHRRLERFQLAWMMKGDIRVWSQQHHYC